jgi:Ran GTPase-activating protein (RanGAP) involved in mRNA processing and transport/predicted Ser/Thr protein kinase
MPKLNAAKWSRLIAQIQNNDSTLTRLDLHDNKIGDAEAKELSAALKDNRTLTSLHLGNNKIGDAGAIALGTALKDNRTLTALHLGNNKIGDAGAIALGTALKDNHRLTILNLGNNKIGDAGTKELSIALTVNGTLTALDLSSNQIDNAGAGALGAALKDNRTLTILNLGNNQIGDSGAKGLSIALTANRTLTALDLISNQIGDEGAIALSVALKDNRTLTKLNLGNNQIGNAGAKGLSIALTTNRTLTVLGLGSKIGDAGAQELGIALTANRTLTTLVLVNNQISDAGLRELSAFKDNGTLTVLDLTNNQIVGSTRAGALGAVLKDNRTLTKLGLGNNQILTGVMYLDEVLKDNRILTSLDLSGNPALTDKRHKGINQPRIESIIALLTRNQRLRDEFHQAVKLNQIERAKALMTQGVNLVSVTGDDHNTPLHWAVIHNLPDIAAFLVQAMQQQKISVDQRNGKDQTPLDIAKTSSNAALIACLTQPVDVKPPAVITNQPSSSQPLPPALKAAPILPTSAQAKSAPAAITTTTSTSPDWQANFILDYNQLALDKELGRGGFGVVYHGTYRFNEVAIKQLHLTNPSKESLEEFQQEMAVMMRLRCPQIVQLYGVYFKPSYGIVMEYMPMGSLYNVLHSDQPLDWNIRYSIATDIACGLAFLHAESIFHQDLKSLNVLLGEHFRAKLTDFGLAKIKNKSQSTSSSAQQVGTLRWMAPEVMEEEPYTAKADMYSYAVTLWELSTRELPYVGKADGVVVRQVCAGKREEQQPIPEGCPPKIAHLIRFGWLMKAVERPSAEDAVTLLKATEALAATVASTTSTEPSYRGNLDSDRGETNYKPF